jgi:hypothetical protein
MQRQKIGTAATLSQPMSLSESRGRSQAKTDPKISLNGFEPDCR